MLSKSGLSAVFFSVMFLVTAENKTILKCDFERRNQLTVPSYSPDCRMERKAVNDAHGGKMILTMQTGKTRGLLQSGPLMADQPVAPRVRLTLFARGRGTLSLGFVESVFSADGKRTGKIVEVPAPAVLNDQWSKLEFTHEFTQSVPANIMIRLQFSPESYAEIDDLRFERITGDDLKIRALTPPAILKQGTEFPVCRFETIPKDVPLQGFIIFPNRSFITQACGKENIVSFDKFSSTGFYRTAAAAQGNSAETHFSILSPAEYDRCDAAARKIKFDKPSRILFLGDSIYDLKRGRNAVDKLGFWLNKYSPGNVEIRNAAVRGDYITRIEARLIGKTKQFQQSKYDRLFEKPYQLIFLAVGANDNRTKREDEYKKPLVSFPEQTAALKRVLQILKRRSPSARIIFIGPTAGNEALQKKRMESAEKNNRSFIRYADPELTRTGIAAQKTAAAEEKIEYIDFYEEMYQAADDSFFTPHDVIHPEERGFNFITLKLLEYLSQNPK